MQFLHQMFNVSALLLDDALSLKPAMPLTSGDLRCGGIFSDNVITNCLLIPTVKEF